MDELADEVRNTRNQWDRETRDGGASFPSTDCGRIFTRLQDQLFGLLGTHVDVIATLGEGIHHSATAYEAIDGNVVAALGGG
ncbi:hypothetical protein [Actinophytocola sediminis]